MFTKLLKILKTRRAEKNNNIKIVDKILTDIKKNKFKALLNYEKKFSKNKEIKLSTDRVNKSIKKLDPKVKKAIDYAYSRIWKFHLKQIKVFFMFPIVGLRKKAGNFRFLNGNDVIHKLISKCLPKHRTVPEPC